MDAIDDSHCRPEHHVLDLGGERALHRPAPAQALEAGPEHRSVAEVQRQPCGRASSGETGEDPAVGVRGSEEPSEQGLSARPDGRCGDPRDGSSQHVRRLILMPCSP
jgi:hypothetical protein